MRVGILFGKVEYYVWIPGFKISLFGRPRLPHWVGALPLSP
jgi:hypothetical protein